jgi:radical SAM-linked protein
VLVTRLLVKFTKTNRAKYISHLDTMRTMHRAFRRAALPISYSQGFNPHASISVAAPLSLGIESLCEYADIDINGEFDYELMKTSLNNSLPTDIKIIDILEIKGKAISAMAAVAYARYRLRFDKSLPEELGQALCDTILNQTEILRLKRTKSGEKLVDIRPMIEDINIEEETDTYIAFNIILQAGSNGSLGTDHITALLKEASGEALKSTPYARREEIYTLQENRKLPLLKYFSGK